MKPCGILMKQVLDCIHSWDSLWREWTVTTFHKLDIDSMDASVDKYLKEISKLKREIRKWAPWIQIRERLFPNDQDKSRSNR